MFNNTTTDKHVNILWRDAAKSSPGLDDEPIICITANNKIQTFTKRGTEDHWKWHVEKYNILYWAYQLELLG